MCGICGKLSWSHAPDSELIRRMAGRMIHRGPDAEGFFAKGPIALGHRRLSIIDTRECGTQPLADVSGGCHIVYNGEVYNFQEIRKELKKEGAEFSTATDTEVIIEAYKRWDVDCVQHFNGMFAFAIWDDRRQRLFMARDRLGKKPLFYQILPDGGVVFASELKALQEAPEVSGKINVKALSHYLSLNYTLTAEPILDGVKSLEAAHYLIFERGKVGKETKYWDLARFFHNKRKFRSEKDAADELSELITDSVRLRLISDVPLGAFLSGGIDSSSIVAAMLRLQSPGDTHTFSIGFKEKSYNETGKARMIAEYLGVNHHDRIVDAQMSSMLPAIVNSADEPFADTSMIPMYYLAKFAREHVKVCLSGDGADEIFAGYETYVADRIHQNTQWFPGWFVQLLRGASNMALPLTFDKVSFDYKVRQFLKGYGLSFGRAHYLWRTIFSDEEKEKLLVPELHKELRDADAFDLFEKYLNEAEGLHYIDQAMYVDIKTWLVDDILVKVDRATMAHSLEARVPFLDYRLVEFAASLPVEMKLKWFQKKRLLKMSQERWLPKNVIYGRKRGFNAPVSHWLGLLHDEFGGKIETAKLHEGLPFFKTDAVDKLWRDHQNGKADNGFKLLTLLCFSLWIDGKEI